MFVKKILQSRAFQAYIFFLAPAIGFLSIFWDIGILPSIIVIAIATLGFLLIVLFQSRISELSLANLPAEFEKIFGLGSGLQIKAKEVLLDLIKVRRECIAETLIFDLLSYHANIDKSGNYSGCYRIKGCNPNVSPCQGITILMGSGSWEVKKLRAFNTQSNEELKIASLSHEKAEIFKFEILFQLPLSNSECFDISYSFELPHACGTTEDDLDIFILWPFKTIKGEVEIDISLLFQPRAIQLFNVYNLNNQLHAALHTEDKPNTNFYANGKYNYSIRINNPEMYHAFVFVYRI